ncbi:MAG: hypothetical protein AB1403_25745, partial [Candidatus Riflebacteria bacterium]
MTQIRETIRKALLELVARRDPTVFQNADVFQKQLQQIGQWPDLPEISALKSGLIERFPWELQKDPDRIVNEKSVVTLAGLLAKKHHVETETALWAVETWGVSLGLKVMMPAEKPKEVTVNTPAPKNTPAFDGPDFSNTRLGVIFGTDEAGLIRVYKSWFGNAPLNETAGLTATTVKIENPKSVPLFTAAPKPRQPKPATSKKSVPPPAKSPAMVKQTQPEP